MPNENYINPRHMGFFYSDSLPDQVAKQLFEGLPPSSEYTLPAYWSYRSHAEFIERYGKLGNVVWSRRTSYSLLLLGGAHALKVHTLGKHCRVELSSGVLNALHDKLIGLKVQPTQHFAGCVTVRYLAEVPAIIEAVKRVYGI